MNMGETKLYSWFLGPKAENADLLERLILEALRDCVFWRRNFHPEDDIIITEKCKREDAFQDSQGYPPINASFWVERNVDCYMATSAFIKSTSCQICATLRSLARGSSGYLN